MPVPVPGPHQDVLPNTDANLDAFGAQFVANFTDVGYDAPVGTQAALAALQTAFAAALTIADNPTTRTSVNIATKNAARVALSAALRIAIAYAVAGFASGAVSSPQLTNIGVRTPDPTRTPIPAPAYAPILAAVSARPGFQDFRITQVTAEGPVSTRKFPYGIQAVQLHKVNADASLTLLGSYRAVNIAQSTATMAGGTTFSVKARYVTAKGLTGPFSETITACVIPA